MYLSYIMPPIMRPPWIMADQPNHTVSAKEESYCMSHCTSAVCSWILLFWLVLDMNKRGEHNGMLGGADLARLQNWVNMQIMMQLRNKKPRTYCETTKTRIFFCSSCLNKRNYVLSKTVTLPSHVFRWMFYSNRPKIEVTTKLLFVWCNDVIGRSNTVFLRQFWHFCQYCVKYFCKSLFKWKNIKIWQIIH